jgi:hypothetical protein
MERRDEWASQQRDRERERERERGCMDSWIAAHRVGVCHKNGRWKNGPVGIS